ncbi:EF-hand [Dendrothele bispora CBS 962.96]|uniref:EF-hand n=1 Tax=Dendrothele bispora (strain CBS 962.96) TaxID=1314807 RepID=A0A4V4HAX7_DENBC|nr:EF-hand [Dendrothele bispora CBS 962.96]
MGPPDADPHLLSWFAVVDTVNSGCINAREFALMNGDWTPFDIHMVKRLISIFGTNRSGMTGFNEVNPLDNYIKGWQNVFRHFDYGRFGSINSGYFQLSPQLLDLAQRKYDPPVKGTTTGGRYQAPPAVSFDRFAHACAAIKQLSEAFRKLDSDWDRWTQIDYDQFMHTMLTLS